MRYYRLARFVSAFAALLLTFSAVPAQADAPSPEAWRQANGCPAGLLPTPAAPSPEIASMLASMPVEVKIGQLLMAGVNELELGGDARHLVEDLHVGNVVLMGAAIDEPAQILALTQGLQQLARETNGVGMLVATDQEGGLVQRIRWELTRLPEARTVGNSGRPDLIRPYGKLAGEELLTVGVNMDLAPVLDVNDNPANPVIGNRAFGTTPDRVSIAATAFMHGLHDAGVIATGKHFPGHGNTSTDSHLTLPYVEKLLDELQAVELAPYRVAIPKGLDAVMLAHVVYPALDPSGVPATVSYPIATCLLRGALGFKGVVVTDDMGMKGISDYYTPEDAVVATVLAGADVVLCSRIQGPDGCNPEMFERLYDGLVKGVEDGRISPERLDQSVQRILALKARYRVGPATGEGLASLAGAAHLRTLANVMQAAGRP